MPYDGTEYTGDPILAVIDRVDRLICDEEHWGQGNSDTRPLHGWPSPNDRHCPRTALTACGVPWCDEPCLVDDYFQRAVTEISPQSVCGPDGDWAIPTYNNAPERTFPEIKALIRKARELRLADIMETVDAG